MRPMNRQLRFPGVLLMLLAARGALAVDAIVLEAREITVAGIPVETTSVRLDVLSDKQTRLTVRAGAATLPEPVRRLTHIALVCDEPVVAEPRYGWRSRTLTARGGPPSST